MVWTRLDCTGLTSRDGACTLLFPAVIAVAGTAIGAGLRKPPGAANSGVEQQIPMTDRCTDTQSRGKTGRVRHWRGREEEGGVGARGSSRSSGPAVMLVKSGHFKQNSQQAGRLYHVSVV